MYEMITSKFGGIVLPGKMITPSGKVWKPNQVVCRLVPEEISVPDEVRELSEQVLAIKQPKTNARTFHFRRALIRRRYYLFGAKILRMEVAYSRYQFNLLHAAFEDLVRKERPEIAEALLQFVSEDDLFDLNKLGGPLSSGVGITTVVVLADQQTIMTHRSKEVSLNADLNHTALAEGVNPEEGLGREIDLPSVAVRAAVEELNLPVDREDLVFLGLAIDGRYWSPGIIAKVEIPLTWQEVKERSERARDRWERDNIRFIPYTPEGIAEELRYALEPGKGVTGFGAIALLESGIYDFGQEEMERAFRNIALQA